MSKPISNKKPLVPFLISILPYQKRRLKELSEITKKNQSELCREALTILFGIYKDMESNNAKTLMDKTLD